MVERLILTLLLVLIGLALFYAWRYTHMWRANRAGMTAAAPLDQPSLLYFRSDSCAPCHTQAYYIQALEREYNGRVAVQKIDVELQPEVASQYGVFTLPTTVIVDRKGTVRHINYGLTDATKLAQQLENNR
jgi:thioredoxin-like negative regulator of GroEL